MSLFQTPAGATLPDAPLNASDPISLTHAGKWLRPVLPNVGSSLDGRISLNRNYGTLYLIVPETLTEPALNISSPAGISIEASQSLNLPDSELFQANPLHEQDDNSNAICDPPERQNPHPCAGDATQDCYDLTIVHSAKYMDSTGSNHVHLWGTEMTVAVKNPKTTQASLSTMSVTHAPVSGPDLKNVWDVYEPSITEDGRMIVVSLGQQGGKLFSWKNNATGQEVSGTYNIMYAYNSAKDACDVTGWNHDFAPVTHAHFDPDLKGSPNYKVKFAQFPLRDPEGQAIPDGVDLGGTYPWIDRSGTNLFFSQVEENLLFPEGNAVGSQYQVTGCVAGSSCIMPAQMSLDPKSPNYYVNFDEQRNTRGLTVAGLWTHGKEVLVDAGVNNTDYGIHGPDNDHYDVQLYANASPTEIGTGRDAEGPPSNWQSSTSSPPPKFYTRNTTIVDSFTNIFNYETQTMKPNSVRDVAWIVNMGKGSSTIAFDDMLDPDALIVADMNASLSFPAQTSPNSLPVLNYHNGFAFDHVKNVQGPLNGDLHLQNIATGTKWNLPAYGTVTTGNLRIEPVSLGGKTGKGLWIDGNSGFQFEIPSQTNVTATPWFVSVFWDNRNVDTEERRLFTFPDHSAVSVQSGTLKFYGPAGGEALHTTVLPDFAGKQWTHLALSIDARNSGESVQVFLNGFHLDTFSPTKPAFILSAGTMQVGAATGASGVRGWVDEFKVIARIPDLETICNHAGGTLMGLDPGNRSSWSALAEKYPSTSQDEVTQFLSANRLETYQTYVCYSDAKSEAGTDFNSVTNSAFLQASGLHTLKAAMHFPEGPLVYNRPRPDSTHNQFCLSCHQSVQTNTALTPAALSLNAQLNMSDDPRRQPFQSPPLIFGNMPKGFLGSNALPPNGQAPSQGFKIDTIVFPAH